MSDNGSTKKGQRLSSVEPRGVEVWGGVEYTCNRVGDRYLDQMERSGHANRIDDYARFVALGIRTLRIGVLWERYEATGSWSWADDHLGRLRELNVRPIVGLVHHGSGPRHTSLLDPEFPMKLAGYAAAVAERYPWIDAFTPVNEPNTTARFSGMYGLWYPHHMDRASYVRALVNQMKATVLSMRAIRRVRPDAELVQTEDVGATSGTVELRPVWEMLNLRRWLPFDLLCGRVNGGHPMFRYLSGAGISEAEIMWFGENPCAPDVIGINYYVTSDRFLDHRIDLYPPDRMSAEGPFVDVEAVRVRGAGISGVGAHLSDAWKRYGLPVAITEVHLGCSVDEQIRWLAESREELLKTRRGGAECVALAPWAMLGSYWWNELVTRVNDHYEPGVFDVSTGVPVATELAEVVSQMARGERPSHPALSQRGWWRQPNRVCYPQGEEVAA